MLGSTSGGRSLLYSPGRRIETKRPVERLVALQWEIKVSHEDCHLYKIKVPLSRRVSERRFKILFMERIISALES